MKLNKYDFINVCYEGEEVVTNFVAHSDEEAFEIAKVLYYVRNSDHWESVEEFDDFVYTLDNVNLGNVWNGDTCVLCCDYLVRKR